MLEPDDIEFTVTSHPMSDTGIGREMGYADDREFLSAYAARRAALPVEEREAFERADRAVDRALMHGDEASHKRTAHNQPEEGR